MKDNNDNRSIICRTFGHKLPYHPTTVEINLPCDRWDNCDIKQHEFSLFHYICKRCGIDKTQRFDKQGLVII